MPFSPIIRLYLLSVGILVMYRALITRGLVFLGGWPVVFPALSVVLHTSYTGKLSASNIGLSQFTSHTLAPAIIVWRIYHTNKSQSDHTSGRSLIPVMAAVIESGAIYSATAIILLSCISANSVGLPVVMDAVPPLVVRGTVILGWLVLLSLRIHRESSSAWVSYKSTSTT